MQRAVTNPNVDLLLTAAAARTLSPDEASALGVAALEARREEDVLKAVTLAVERSPHAATPWHVLGLLHRAIGDLAPALAALDRAVALTPDSPVLIHARARATAEAGLDSLDWYARARALAPNDGDVILGHAAALDAARDHTAADALLAAMLANHPGWFAGHGALLRMRHAAGDPTWLAVLDAAIAGAPTDWRLHQLKISALLRARHDAATNAALHEARAWCGDQPPIRALAAMAATEQGRLDAADAAFDALDPLGDPTVTVHWLRHLLRRHQPERIAVLHGRLPAHSIDAAWPYLSLAWRLLDDPRHAWLDDSRLVRIIDIGTDWPEFARLADTLRALHVTRAQPLDQSVRGGTQTDGPLLSRIDPVIAAVRARLIDAVRDYIAALPPRDAAHPLLGRIPRHPRFAGSWSVRLSAGGRHDPHVHPEGWLSSAFYVALPSRSPDADVGRLTLGHPQASLETGLPAQQTIDPLPGRLVLFPSTMWHGTLPFPAGERLTVAFDVT
ncbi:putative 2OG-Fe(II) oxygenase [Sphingomonas sp. SUN019]|uniref:putative 2OG-Fe(II) oxygenase n=1 Tax=Sphingomonas sp. SUN019 TaxID=2937788 RepID=UPI00216491F3|nr:putative 2OG-Fe(II) oxygenase [Sphingomonas sp. SUN019]UVO50447.1 putative 2OG-Fe(II) oxygenase [Sphingomonas sp. SUN019]